MNTKIREAVISAINNGKNKGQIEGFLKYEFDLSNQEARDMVDAIFEEQGVVRTVATADHSETVAYLRANYGKVDKKVLIDGMCEVNGKTYKTNQHAYNYIAMMIEWAKQEVESN
jgi:hypothetical protein